MENRVLKTIDGVEWREHDNFELRYSGHKDCGDGISLEIKAIRESYGLPEHAYLTENVVFHEYKPTDDRPFIYTKYPFRYSQSDPINSYLYEYEDNEPTISKREIRKYHLPLLNDLGRFRCDIFNIQAQVSLLGIVIGENMVHGFIVRSDKKTVKTIHRIAHEEYEIVDAAFNKATKYARAVKKIL